MTVHFDGWAHGFGPVNRTLSQVDHFQRFGQRSFTNMNSIYNLKKYVSARARTGDLSNKKFLGSIFMKQTRACHL